MTTSTGVRFSDAQLQTGVRLNYAERGNPAGRPVIMLHGYTDSWFSFSRVLPLLNEDLRAIAVTQRGHGDSERPRNGYALDDLAADTISLMDALEIERATIVGHCMGSHVAQRVALSAPERVEALVLVSSATTLCNEAVVGLAQEVENLQDPVHEKFVREFQESTVHLPVPDEFMTSIVTESLKLPARVWRALMSGFLAAREPVELERIKTPALILWGDRDQLFPRSEQTSLLARIPDASLRVYAQTGHSPQWERPAEFAADLEEFITQTTRRMRRATEINVTTLV